jgi:hypothetical protein
MTMEKKEYAKKISEWAYGHEKFPDIEKKFNSPKELEAHLNKPGKKVLLVYTQLMTAYAQDSKKEGINPAYLEMIKENLKDTLTKEE